MPAAPHEPTKGSIEKLGTTTAEVLGNVVVMVAFLGRLVTAITLAGQTKSAIAAELGTMRLSWAR